jgi:hypothetical protein
MRPRCSSTKSMLKSWLKPPKRAELVLVPVMSPMEPTLNLLEHDLVVKLKAVIERDVEKVVYFADRKSYTMSCFLFMRNGMIIEGSGLLLNDTQIAKDVSRRNALKVLRTIQQYIMAEDLCVEAGLGCGEDQFKNQLKGKT